LTDVKVITVIGSWQYGHQIGTLCALHGFEPPILTGHQILLNLKKRRTSSRRTLPGTCGKGRISQETADY